MDEFDRRLRDRLQRLAEAVPAAPEAAKTQAVLLDSPAPMGLRQRRAMLMGAVAVVALLAVAAGLGVGALRQRETPSPSAAAIATASPGASAASAEPTVSDGASASPVASRVPVESTAPTVSPIPAEDTWPRYADGIPSEWIGEHVFRGDEALAQVDAATAAGDAKPFYLGGWLTVRYGSFGCTVQPPGLASWAWPCNGTSLSDEAGATDGAYARAITFSLMDTGSANPTDSLKSGPVIVRVHVHDGRAAECTGSSYAVCDRMMVVEEVLWAGDAVTAPRPVSVDAALTAIRSVDSHTKLLADGPTTVRAVCGGDLLAATTYLADPAAITLPSVVALEVLPTVAARQRALQLAEGVAGAWTAKGQICEGFAPAGPNGASQDRVLAVGNIVVTVHLHLAAGTADRRFVARLGDALTAAQSSGPASFRQPTVHGTQDPESLTPRGWQRAGAIVGLFVSDPSDARGPRLPTPTHVFASQVGPRSSSQRPRETLLALSERLGLAVDARFRKEELDELVKAVEAIDGIVLIAWEHHLIPSLAAMFVRDATAVPQVWPDDRYDVVWVIEDAETVGGRRLREVPQMLLAGDQPRPISPARLT